MTATLQGDHDVAGKLGDIHAALFVSERTGSFAAR